MASQENNGSPRSRPFLSSEQREALDAALAEKQDKNKSYKQDRRWMVHRRSRSRDFYDKMERKSKSGKGLGSAKKSGSGGKFTWGALVESEGVAVLDKSDPNYNSEDDKHVVYRSKIREEVEQYKKRVTSIIDEFYDNGDMNEAASLLYDLELPHFAQYFVKKAVTMALDRRDREREMTSVLLSSLYNEVIMPEQMRKGFLSVIESVDDLKLDVPEAPELISLFIARAVVDDILAPAIVDRDVVMVEEDSAIKEIQEKVHLHLSARHCTERLLRVWGGGAGLNYQDTKDSIVKMLYEYTSSHDIEEARRCLRNLGLKFFHHEFVKQAIHMAMDNSMHRGAFLELLGTLFKDGEISEVQIKKGFHRVATKLDDTVLDNPSAKEQFSEVVAAAKSEKVIGQDLDEIMKDASTTSDVGSHTTHPHTVQAFKLAAQTVIREYFESSDVDEVAESLIEMEDPGLNHIFVKHAIQLALDRRDREREMISVLLSTLYPQVLTGDQLGQGFARILASVEDLVLDNPDAAHLISQFLGRIIVDEVLPPSFLTSVLGALKDDSLGIQVVQATGSMLSARHASERLLNCWHGGSKDIEQIRDDIKAMLKEYLSSKDIKEVTRCLHDLSVPFYHHELVRRALEMALESDASLVDMSNLLSHLAESGDINETQMKKGFDRMDCMIEDLALDYPNAKERYGRVQGRAAKESWLEATLEPSGVPSS
ncbi:hypothetical protein BSKO_03231 [Bryopsis sp. KO-2023]|nr:hypothetical protein BSKO_03231 [Bryopsis sp. KO-2023]